MSAVDSARLAADSEGKAQPPRAFQVHPSPHELKIGFAALELLLGAFPKAKVIALGKSVKKAVDEAGFTDVIMATHPGHGGGESFAEAIALAD